MKHRHVTALGLSLAIGIAAAAPGLSQTATTLPGGATSLTEEHDDWTMQCGPAAQATTPRIACAVSQEQLDPKSHQRVLAIGLSPAADAVTGTLIMPFGLSLSSGVTLQVDDSAEQTKLSFHTCLPDGCLIALSWPADAVKGLRNGTKLNIGAVADNGQKVAFAVSLNGLGSALDRALALTK